MNSVFNAFLEPVILIAPKVPGAILNLIIGYLIITLVMYFVRRAVKLMKLTAAIKSLIISIIKAALWAFLLVFILNYLGLGSLIVALTGSAVFLGFLLNNGLSQTISDIFAGISLSGEKDFKIGNRVSLNEGKITGVITAFNTRKVKLVDNKGQIHVIPNSMFDKNEWILLEEKKIEGHKSKK